MSMPIDRNRGCVGPRRASLGRARGAALALLAGGAALAACGDITVDAQNFPAKGTLEGTLVYTGPPPCVQRDHVLGTALLLVFNEDLLPPPEGFGTSASQLGAVMGDVLFSAITEQLPSNPGEGVVCPPPGSPNVTVSAPWKLGPLPAGRWQVRAFYDYDGDFSPILKTHQLPTAGDIGGGAIANVPEVLAGKKVRYQTIEIGTRQADGTFVMPEKGAHVEGIAVTIGQPLPMSRPIFHYKGVKDERPTEVTDMMGVTTTAPPVTQNTDPAHVVLPQDERFLQSPTVALTNADKQFIRLELGAGLPGDSCEVDPNSERCRGVSSPFFLQTVPPHDRFWLFPDVDENGVIKGTPEKAPVKIPSLFPQAIFARLDPRDAALQTAQAEPAVVLQGLTLNEGSALQTLESLFMQNGKVVGPKVIDTVTVALRPSVICLNPTDVEAPVYVVTPSFKALDGGVVIDPDDTAPKVKAQLGNRPNVQIIEGCLPQGRYQANLVYPTGQAWTVPNEAGACVGPETPQGTDGCQSGSLGRKILPSQEVTLEIGAEREPGFCAKTFTDPNVYVNGVPKWCLRSNEGGSLAKRAP